MKKTFYLSAFAVGLSSLNAANAATATGTLTVRATVTNSCVLNTSATGTTANAVLDFGTLSSLAGNVDADTTTTGGTQLGCCVTTQCHGLCHLMVDKMFYQLNVV